MNNKLFLLLIILFLVTNIVRLVYEVLKYRKQIVTNRIIYICIFFDMIIMFISWYILCSIDNSFIHIPKILQLFGLLLFLLGILLVIISRAELRTFETQSGSQLITDGIYSKFRHPMYLGFLFWAIGLPLYNGVLYSLILSLPFSLNILFWRYIEEKELINKFPEYKKYKETTLF